MKIRIKQVIVALIFSFLLCGCSANDKEAEAPAITAEDSQNAIAGDTESAADGESARTEDNQNAEPENEQEELYEIDEYGTVQEDTREFTDEATGKLLYYYTMIKFFFRDDFPNTDVINQTLQRIYDKYEDSYIAGAEDYTGAEDEYLNTPYSLWNFLCLEYVGDDYISISI